MARIINIYHVSGGSSLVPSMLISKKADSRVQIGVCVGCPLWDVCSDECGMNDANGYYPEDDRYDFLDYDY